MKKGVMIVAAILLFALLVAVGMFVYSPNSVPNIQAFFSPQGFGTGYVSNLDGQEVISQGTLNTNEMTEENINTILRNIDPKYINSSNEEENLYFVIGNEKDIRLYVFKTETKGDVSLIFAGQRGTFEVREIQQFSKELNPENNKVKVQINQKEIELNLVPGKVVYYVIK